MKSIGYGAYGDFGVGAKDVIGAITGGLTALAGQLFEPVIIEKPEELKGAKLSRAFKIVKEADKYKITFDVEAANKIAKVVPTELASFVGVIIDDPSKEFEKSIGIGTIKYIPPPSNMKMLLIAAVVVLGLIVVYQMFLKKK
jgi:hypothetical protein